MRLTSSDEPLQMELQYNPRFRDGVAVCSFNVWLEPGSVLVHEWRSGLGNRRIGPRLVFRPDRLLVGAEETFLTPIPAAEWVRVEVVCGLGHRANVPAVFDLTISIEQTPEPFEGLACVYRRFRAFDRCLFLGRVEEEASHSLDNIHIELK